MIPLEALIEILDWQTEFYDHEARQALIAASNSIYEHIHRNDDTEHD